MTSSGETQGRQVPPTLPPLAILVLGLVAERPMHPYEMLQTTVERKEDRLVKFRPGTLYHAVDRLAENALIEIHEVRREGNRPERTIYAITPAGRAALEHNLELLLQRHPTEYPALYLALSEAHGLPRRRVIELLTRRVESMRADLDEVCAATQSVQTKGTPEMFYLDAGCRITTLRAQIAWLENLLERLRDGQIDWIDDPGSPYSPVFSTPTADERASTPESPSTPERASTR